MEQALFYLAASPFAIILLIACIVCALVNRKKGNFTVLIWFMSLTAITICLTDMELLAGKIESLIFFSHMTYSVLPLIPVAWFIFCLDFSARPERKISFRLVAILSLVPAATIAFAWTNSLHHLLWVDNVFVQDGQFLTNRVTVYGLWFWINTLYSYLLLLAGTALIFKDFFTLKKSARHQSVSAVIGVSIPVAINCMYVFRLIPGIYRDYSSLGFAVSSLLFLTCVIRTGMAAEDSLTNGNILEQMDQAIVILDSNGRVQNQNERATRMLGGSAGRNVPITDILPIPFEEMRKASRREGFAGKEIPGKDTAIVYVHMYPLKPNSAGKSGYTLVLHDTSFRDASTLISRRERDVYDLLVADKTTKEIAEALCISENTVKTHTKHIYEKMHVTNKKQLIGIARIT